MTYLSNITFLTRSVCWTGRFFVDALEVIQRVHKKALLISAFSLFPSLLWAATLPGTTLTNNATAAYQIAGTPYNLAASAVVVTNATIQFMAATSGGTSTPIGASQCASSGLASGPFDLSGGVAAGSVAIAPTTVYGSGQTIYVKVVDYWKNQNPALAETLAVTLAVTIISTTAPNDREILLLTETGPDTGVFAGAILGSRTTTVNNDCRISVGIKVQLSASYVYRHDSSSSFTTATTVVLVDPFGTVFDSVTGAPLDGAIVTMIDASTGLPATVLCDDGLLSSPNPMVTGSTFVACGGTVVMTAGSYRFPLVNPGNYILQVQPPATYTFASTNPAPAGGYAVAGSPGAGGASYGSSFLIPPGSPPLLIDIPLDPAPTDLQITKVAGKTVVSEGEYVPYMLTIRNKSNAAIASPVRISDRLPQGLRYQVGSALLDGILQPDPTISADGRTLLFDLAVGIAASASITLKYVALVTSGTPGSKAENVAYSTSHTSNIARASVTIREDLMRSRAILMGRVIIGSCDGHVDNDQDGLQNARIVLEDGTYILTDKDGRWHADNIRPGTHVVQLDLDSLADDYEVQACEENARFAGRSYSQFVNVRGGSLWRADFHVQKKTIKEMHITHHLTAQRKGDVIRVELKLHGDGKVLNVSTSIPLPANARFIANSVELDGRPSTAVEHQDGILQLSLGKQQGDWKHTLAFDLMIAGQASLELMAMTRFVAPSASQGVSLPRATVQVDAQAASAKAFAVIPPPVPNQESPNAPGAQYRGERNVRLKNDAVPQPLNADSRNRLVEQLPYNADWLTTAQPGIEWLHPLETFLPALPTIKVAVKLVPGQRAMLKLNGEEVSPLNYEGEIINSAGTVSLATWNGVHIKDGDNQVELTVVDASGNEVLRQSRNVRYTVSPYRVELVPGHSRLVADGKTRPILALRFLDKDGYKMRRGINGEFQLNSPYESMDEIEAVQRDPLSGKINGKPRYEVGTDGIALIALAPTTQSGQAVLNFKFTDGRTQELRAWLEAGQRDWILVGFGQGTIGHKKLSGNIEALQEAGADDQLFDGDRIALYAKGSVKGEYLVTMAYDSAKQQRNNQTGIANLKQAVDPNQYYTLYADATQPYFDAASSSKLYLKIERKQFYALFGDYDTGLNVTEFSRYSRTVNGLKSEYKGEDLGYTAFATTTTQAYVKDEIPGDGTSGLYHLTRTNIVENSDKIRIETRDRFQSHIILSSQSLARYLDYEIDYATGALFFKQAINARDSAFNPVYIVAEYESGDPRDKNLTAGGRVNFKPADKLEVGATLVREGTEGASGNLQGLDANWQLSNKTKIQAELARSDRDLTLATSNLTPSGNAWKAELTHQQDDFDSKVYIREQDAGFGLGQQSFSESSTRKMGGEARLKISPTSSGQFSIYRQDTLGIVDTRRSVLDARVNNTLGSLTTYYGGRYAGDDDGMGSVRDSKQALAGVGYTLPNKKLTVRAGGEVGLDKSESIDFPDRLNLGADYALTKQTKLFVEQEFARGNNFSSDMTRAGMSTQPWTGASLAASLGNQSSLDSGRTYANLGLVQRWQVNEFWQLDAGMDRAKIIRSSNTQSLNPRAQPAFGSLTGDYTAVGMGANYNNKIWGANTRIERRISDFDKKLNLLFGLQRNLDAGRVLASGFAYTGTDSAISKSRKSNVRLSYASRPWDSAWIWLDRLDYTDERTNSLADSGHVRKLVNNYNANWMIASQTQLALQYGGKYVFDTINNKSYKGYTDLAGAELRHNLNRRWDTGVHASMLHSWGAEVKQYGLGASLGYMLVDNAWLVGGYNFLGFSDADFSGASYRAQGVYISLRLKVDQDTLKLNDKTDGPFAHKL